MLHSQELLLEHRCQCHEPAITCAVLWLAYLAQFWSSPAHLVLYTAGRWHVPETVSSRQPGGREASSVGGRVLWLTVIVCHMTLRPEKP